MNTFEVIDVLNKGGVIEKGKTQYSRYNDCNKGKQNNY